jgi:hypothetical protein
MELRLNSKPMRALAFGTQMVLHISIVATSFS